jgi:hypothetical protein
MPVKSDAQFRLMAAAAHNPGGFGGVSRAVGREFVPKGSHKPRGLPTRARSSGRKAGPATRRKK